MPSTIKRLVMKQLYSLCYDWFNPYLIFAQSEHYSEQSGLLTMYTDTETWKGLVMENQDSMDTR